MARPVDFLFRSMTLGIFNSEPIGMIKSGNNFVKS